MPKASHDGNRGEPIGTECEVSAEGVTHLFEPFVPDARCVCGRKIVRDSGDGRLDIEDAESEAA
jgi:hypothetical protein